MGNGRVNEKGVGVNSTNFLNCLLFQPLDQTGLYVIDENLHLLPEADIQKLLSDLMTPSIASPVSFPDVLKLVVFSTTSQGLLCAIQPYLGFTHTTLR